MSVVPHAEPFHAAGGSTAVLLVHGFTGSPASMRPWASSLAAAGFTVALPRLPGHGTQWQDLNETRWTDWYAEVERCFDGLRTRCDRVFVAGLSMGGCLALRLAEQRRDDVAGLLLVNPSVLSSDRRLVALPVLQHFVGSVAGVGNDIKKPGPAEYAYDRVPLKALASLRRLWRVTRDDLIQITAPMLVFRSAVDHVVEALSTQTVTQGVSSRDVTEQVLAESYHVATLDNDADTLFAESVRFISRHTPALADSGGEPHAV